MTQPHPVLACTSTACGASKTDLTPCAVLDRIKNSPISAYLRGGSVKHGNLVSSCHTVRSHKLMGDSGPAQCCPMHPPQRLARQFGDPSLDSFPNCLLPHMQVGDRECTGGLKTWEGC